MTIENQPLFRLPVRVYIEDTDAGGIVFYANYLKYMERARTEFIRSLGIELRAGMSNNINYVVHSLEVKYKRPARLDDLLNITVSVLKTGKAYLLFEQTVVDDKENMLVLAQVKVACTYLDTGKPRALDIALIDVLTETEFVQLER